MARVRGWSMLPFHGQTKARRCRFDLVASNGPLLLRATADDGRAIVIELDRAEVARVCAAASIQARSGARP